MVWETIIAAKWDKQAEAVADLGRWFDNGSRESRGTRGKPELAATLLGLTEVHTQLCESIALILYNKEETASGKIVLGDAKKDVKFISLFLNHRNYLELLQGIESR